LSSNSPPPPTIWISVSRLWVMDLTFSFNKRRLQRIFQKMFQNLSIFFFFCAFIRCAEHSHLFLPRTPESSRDGDFFLILSCLQNIHKTSTVVYFGNRHIYNSTKQIKMHTQFYIQFPIAHIRYFGRQRGDGAATHPILWDFRRSSPKTSLKLIYMCVCIYIYVYVAILNKIDVRYYLFLPLNLSP
jgi:hypothetical protein